MTKTELLIQRSQEFRKLLRDTAKADLSLVALLDQWTPLFEAIEQGKVVPPCEGVFQPRPFRGEGAKYGFPHPLHGAMAEFVSALEDWPSRPSWVPDEPGGA
jgi:hypothetical protein